MKITSTSTLILLSMLLLFSCMTPEQALQKGHYETALRLAAKQVENGKDVQNNQWIMQTSAAHIINRELESKKALVNSPKVKDWIKARKSYYKVLKHLWQVNTASHGAILTEYDNLCSIKKELDFKIVDYYYQRGMQQLDKFYKEGQKSDARSAYYQFDEAIKNGGKTYYNNLEDLKEESHQNGIVYYVGDRYIIGSSLFLKPLPSGADFEPDCDIDIDYGLHTYSTSTSSSSQSYSAEVVVGHEEVKDTSGQVTLRAIYEEVHATVTTTEVTVTASTWTEINSRDLTGQCTVSSHSFHTSVSDSCEEIEISGDDRAVPAGVSEQTCSELSIESQLSIQLDDEVERQLSGWF